MNQIKLENTIPLGRKLSEYISMFDLEQEDLTKCILDCGGGPSSFNSEMKLLGHNVVSIDPIYAFSAKDIKKESMRLLII